MTVVALISATAERAERDSAAAEAILRVFPLVGPEELAAALRTAPTRERRTLLSSLGLLYKRAPSPTVAASLLDRVRSDATLLPQVGELVASALHQRLHAALDGAGPEVAASDADELVRWLAEQFSDVAPPVLAWALFHHALHHPTTSVMYPAMLLHLMRRLPGLWDEATGDLETMIAERSLDLFDDAPLRFAERLAGQVEERHDETVEQLGRVVSFAGALDEPELLVTILDDLESLAGFAQVQQTMLDTLADWHDGGPGAEEVVTLGRLREVLAELTPVTDDPDLLDLLRLEGPAEVADEIAQLRGVAAQLLEAGEPAPAALAGFASLLRGDGDDPFATVRAFSGEFPDLHGLALALATGSLGIADPDEPEEGAPADTGETEAVVVDGPDEPGAPEAARPDAGSMKTRTWAPFADAPVRAGADDVRDIQDQLKSTSDQAVAAEPAPALPIDPEPGREHLVAPLPEPVVAAVEAPAGRAPHEGESAIVGSDDGTERTGSAEAADHAEEIDAATGEALRAGRFGLAHHLAAAAGHDDRAVAFGLAALCAEARTADGPCAVRFKDAAASAAGIDDLAARIVLLAAATRMSLIAPHSGASSLVAKFATSIDGYPELADAAVSAAQQGVALVDDVLAKAGSLDEADRAVDAATTDVRHFLDTAASKTIKYQRATDVWLQLVGNGGVLRELLLPIVAASELAEHDRREVATRVRERAALLRSPKAHDAAVKAANKRRHKQNIHSGAQEKLQVHWDETLALAEDWSRAVMAAERAHHTDGRMWQHIALDALKTASDRSAPTVDAWLDQQVATSAQVVAAAAVAARHLLGSVRSMLTGISPEGGEPTADQALNQELLADPAFRLDEDFGLVTAGADAAGLVAAARTAPLDAIAAAFAPRADAMDHVGTGLVVELVARAHRPEAAELEDRRDTALAQAREATREAWRAAIDRLASDRRLGLLTEAVYAKWNGVLVGVDPSERDDLDVVRSALEAVLGDADVNRRAMLDEFTQRLDQVAAEHPAVAAARARILERVEDGDLATAEEYMAYARDGEAIPEPDAPPEDGGSFSAELDELLTQVDLSRAAVGEAAVAGEQVGPLDFAVVDPGSRQVLEAGFRQWRELSRMRQISETVAWDGLLTPILRVLGCTATRLRRGTGQRGEHQWIDLVGFASSGGDRAPLVPAFAPDAGFTTLRKLLVLTSATSADALEGIVGREGPGTPVIVLYPGALGPHRRRHLAEVFHRSERAVAVIDANLFAWIAARGGGRFETTMRAVLPFVRTNPYQLDAYGLVPPSMFYGRDDELGKVLRQDGGTSYVYGGRQLGKSALLRQAHRAFNAQPNHVAVYLDLKVKQVGQPRPASDVWEELWEPLRRAGVIGDVDLPAVRVAAKAIESIIGWLDGVPGRRLLLLLDEADKFFESDLQQTELAVSGELKGLMEQTNRRCKIVFAGLHTVQRFASVAPSAASNPPVVHLGEPLAIGPLDGRDAAELVSRPTWALGWRFASGDLINRILAHTNRQPALIVIFMYHLLEQVASRPRGRGEPPSTITAADVDAVWADPPVTRAILERVRYTLNLDPAYSVISHVVAYNHHLYGGAQSMPAAELRDQCVEWWPAGFGQMLLPDFQLIADEMIGLGVLAKEGNTYRLRSPNVARLLGSKDDIEAVLCDASLLEPTAKFEPARWRRAVQPADGSPAFRSPLSDAQLADICTVAFQTRIVAATPASGLSKVPHTLAAALSPRSTHHTTKNWNEPELAHRYFKPLGDGRHRVVIVTLEGAPHLQALALVEAAAAATRPLRQRGTGAGTLAVVFVAHATRNGPLLRAIGASPVGDQVPIVAAGPWTVEAIVNFGRDASDVPSDTRPAAEQVHAATGGWDLLVAAAADMLARGTSLDDALERLPTDRLDAEIDVARDPVLEEAWREVHDGGLGATVADPDFVAEYLHGLPAITAAAQAAHGNLGVADTADGTSLVTHLLQAGLLVGTGDGVTVEPVAARLHF